MGHGATDTDLGDTAHHAPHLRDRAPRSALDAETPVIELHAACKLHRSSALGAQASEQQAARVRVCAGALALR
ncbi:hypothetical protein C8J57DRAFT_1502397 [Mycena rebaudengoi]|nr:hypothetical protein C8J57DRAFT_1502397 [Mycena rebaudengoi]